MTYIPNKPKHLEGDFCPVCQSKQRQRIKWGRLRERKGRFGDFLGCSRYPDCKYTHPIWFYDPVKNEFGLDPKRDWYEASNYSVLESYERKKAEEFGL